MPFSFAKREKEVLEKLAKLSRETIAVASVLKEFVECFLGGCPEVNHGFLEVKKIERRCDDLRREIISEVYKGLFLPDMREVIHTLSEAVDKIVNKCESVSKIIYYQRPKVPGELKDGILTQLSLAIETAKALTKAVDKLFDNISEAHHFVLEVERLEHEEDVVEGKLLEELFKLELPLEEKLQLKELLINIGDIVDRMEDASDILEVLLLKINY